MLRLSQADRERAQRDMGKLWDNKGDSNALNLTVWTPKANFGIHMTKIKFVKHPRSIVRKRHDHPSSLFVTIPKKIVRDWHLQAGQIVEFSILVEGQDISIKVRKV